MSTLISTVLLTSLGVSAAVFCLLWGISVLKKDASIVDIMWGPGCALPAWTTYYLYGTGHPAQVLLLALVTIWALRLGLHLGIRNLPHGEDIRYQHMRKRAGSDQKFAVQSLFTVFLLQSVISWFVSFPVQLGQLGLSGDSIGLFGLVGALIWLIGILFETIGDWQLKAFKKDPANTGKLMDQGLWAWTRHPNYFGDSMVWTGITVAALESPYGVYTLLSPALMTFFLVKVSGKALLEKIMSKKYPEYEAYKARTSGFIPMPPKGD